MFAFRKDKSHVKNNRTKDIWFVIAKWNSFGLRFEPGSNNPLQHPRRISIFLLVRLRCVQTALSYRDRFKFSSITFSRLIGQLAKINSSISPLCTFHRSSVFRLKLFHTLCRCDTKNVHKNHARVWPLLACQVAICCYTARIFFPRKQQTQHVLPCAEITHAWCVNSRDFQVIYGCTARNYAENFTLRETTFAKSCPNGF